MLSCSSFFESRLLILARNCTPARGGGLCILTTAPYHKYYRGRDGIVLSVRFIDIYSDENNVSVVSYLLCRDDTMQWNIGWCLFWPMLDSRWTDGLRDCCVFSTGAWVVWSHPDHSRGQRGDCAHRDHQALCLAGQFGWRIRSNYTGRCNSLSTLVCIYIVYQDAGLWLTTIFISD